MKFKFNNVYRHISCLDIDIYVCRILSWSNPDEISVIVKYWNRHLKQFQGDKEVVFIKKEDIWKWRKV
jgi:hypothetical protein